MFSGMLSLERFTDVIIIKLSIFRKDVRRLTGTKAGGEDDAAGTCTIGTGNETSTNRVDGKSYSEWDISALLCLVLVTKVD